MTNIHITDFPLAGAWPHPPMARDVHRARVRETMPVTAAAQRHPPAAAPVV